MLTSALHPPQSTACPRSPVAKCPDPASIPRENGAGECVFRNCITLFAKEPSPGPLHNPGHFWFQTFSRIILEKNKTRSALVCEQLSLRGGEERPGRGGPASSRTLNSAPYLESEREWEGQRPFAL